MNQDLRNDCIRDDLLRFVRARKRTRRAGWMVALLVPVWVGVALLRTGDPASPRIVSIPEEAAPVPESPPGYIELKSNQELMDHLAHLGPVIVTREDGSQVLYLTNYEAGGGGDSPGMQ